MMVDADRKGRAERVRIIHRHLPQFEPVSRGGRHWHTHQPPGVLGHEVDLSGRGLASEADQIPFGFPVKVIHDNDQPTLF